MAPRWTPAEEAWLAENYGSLGAVGCAEGMAELFGRPTTVQAVHVKANKMGLHADHAPAIPPTCRTVRWCEEPEMQAWMDDADVGQPICELSAEFAERFGFPLSKSQVSLWRSSNGRQARHGRGGGRPALPVGTEKMRNGYVEVKVSMWPTVPQSKDNWVQKHRLVYERENGPVPEGSVVMFADRDTMNFDPGNLVCVPRGLVARVNARQADWHDRESLLSVMASERLATAILDAKRALPRTCAVCGREFTLSDAQRYVDVRTCPECVAAGFKAPPRTGRGGGSPDAACAVCGAPFARERKNQTRCRACIDDAPRLSAAAHRSRNRSMERRR